MSKQIMDMNKDTALVVGVPSKGRLQEECMNLLGDAGFKVVRAQGERHYHGSLNGFDDVLVRFISAGEIAFALNRGDIHCGITGLDLVKEREVEFSNNLFPVVPLEIGRADVVVAVPEGWLDVDFMADLDDAASQFRYLHGERMKVATKFIHLTRCFFNQNHVKDYRIVESLGATEAAPGAGAADLIVDITTTGNTLRANGLKILKDGIILSSQSYLFVSRSANWSAKKLVAFNQIATGIRSSVAARRLLWIELQHNTPEKFVEHVMSRFASTTETLQAQIYGNTVVLLISTEVGKEITNYAHDVGAKGIVCSPVHSFLSPVTLTLENLKTGKALD